MSDIALRTYVEQLDNLIERKQVDEVIAHCRHILSYYPKHVDTYRILGKALLEKGRHGDAADIFQRVLSVLPDDFIAHVGMAIIREDEANLEAAIWHMERAFESTPSNGAIQQELCRLIGRRDGVVPPKARLTRGALARMYTLGGLYLQAEAELKAALSEDADRVDLQALLAQVYWHTDQAALAAQTSGLVLQKLPYNQPANRILFDLFRAQGRADDAAGYRKRLEALDPYEALTGSNGYQDARDVEADKVTLPRLDYVPGMESSGSPDWIASIGARFEDREAEAGEDTPEWLRAAASPASSQSLDDVPEGGDLPGWLQEAAANAPDLGAPVEAAAPTWLSDLGNAESPDDDLPEWLRAASTGPLTGEEVPEWMQGTAGTVAETPAAEQTMPGWMRDAASELVNAGDAGEVPAAGDAEAGAAEAALPPTLASDDDVPAWLKTVTPSVPGEEVPDWLVGLTGAQAEAAEQPTTLPAEAAAPADLPDWLAGVAAAVATEPAAEAPPAASDTLPAWLAPEPPEAADEPTEPTKAAEESAAEPAAAELAAAETPAAPEPIPGYDTLPDWLSAAAAAQQPEPAAEAPTAPMPPSAAADTAAGAVAEDELPDWLKSLQAHTQAEANLPPWLQGLPDDDTPGNSLPDWLDELGAPPAATAEPASHEAATAEPPAPADPDATLITAQPEAEASDLPDWLKPETPPESTPLGTMAAAAATLADVPDWLKPDDAAEAGEAEGAELDAEAAPEALADEAPFAMDMPDWLKAAAANAPPPDAVPAAESEAGPAVELPDFLQPASPEAIARAEQPYTFSDEAVEAEEAVDTGAEPVPADIPDWLQALRPAPAVDEAPAASRATAADLPEDIDLSQVPHWLAAPTAEVPASAVDLNEAAAGEMQAPLADEVPAEQLPDWLRESAEQAAADLPPWAQPQAPGPTDTVVNWLADKEVPEWLRELRAQSGEAQAPADEAQASTGEAQAHMGEAAQAEPASPEALEATGPMASIEQPAEPVALPEATTEGLVPDAPDLDNMDPEEAMRWLEGLAARQGAAAETLFTLDAAAGAAEATGAAEPAEAEPTSLPDWLRQAEAEMPADVLADTSPRRAVAAEAPAEEAQPASAAEPAAMDEDEALRWLESLAARQGASADELFTGATSEDAAATPDWIAAATEAAAAAAEAAVAPSEESEPSITEASAAASAIESPAEGEAAGDGLAALNAALDAEAAASPLAMNEDEALRWLESLAARQGAPAEELITGATAETVETPDWVAADVQAAAVEAEPVEAETPRAELAEAPEAETPAAPHAADETIIETPPAAPAAAEAPGVVEPDRDRLSRLADRLASARRAREAEIEARFAERRAQEEAARREVQARMAAQRAAMEAAAALRRQQAEPPTPPPEPAAELPAAQPAAPAPEPVAAPQPAAYAPRRLRGRRAPAESAAPLASQPPEAVLAQARQHIEARDYAAAADALSAVVRSGQHLDEAVAVLEAAAADPAAPAVVLRALGDAYNRANRLPEALEAYRRALTRL